MGESICEIFAPKHCKPHTRQHIYGVSAPRVAFIPLFKPFAPHTVRYVKLIIPHGCRPKSYALLEFFCRFPDTYSNIHSFSPKIPTKLSKPHPCPLGLAYILYILCPMGRQSCKFTKVIHPMGRSNIYAFI